MSMSAELVDLEMEDEQTASSNQMILGKHLTAMMGLPSNPSQQEVKMQDDKKASGSVSLAAVQNQARPSSSIISIFSRCWEVPLSH